MQAILDLFKSKRFWLIVGTALIDIVIIAVPNFEQYRATFLDFLNILVGILVAGFSLQDAAVSWKTGTSKYVK